MVAAGSSARVMVRYGARGVGEVTSLSCRLAGMVLLAALHASGEPVVLAISTDGPQWSAAVLAGEMEAGSPLVQDGICQRSTSSATVDECRYRFK